MNSNVSMESVAEARFWKQKYLEELVNHAQVVAALMRPQMAESAVPSIGTPPEPESPATEQPAARNGAAKKGVTTQ